MKASFLHRTIACVLLGSLVCSAQEKGYWRAASNTAASITGDITISDTKISINFTSFTMAHIRDLQPAETGSVFAAEDLAAGGTLYRLNVPAGKRFLRHNTLCGSEDTQWMVASAAGKTLHVAFFSGADAPVFTPEAMNNSTALCGTFTYAR